ncbi:MAG: hypothetical protein NDJ94_22885 [Vicinamibacteria bacterium]|nr:hypothetical protein [Vicinamibacteria bacterium]
MKAASSLALALGLWAVGSWPAALAVVPGLGVFGGPLGPALVVLATAVAAARAAGCDQARVFTRLGDLGPVRLFVLGFVWLAVCGEGYATRLRVTGDEPHYLVMAQSLWREGDLDLGDNYARGDTKEYTPAELAPHYGAPRADGRPFPAHSPGLPALLAPVYALGGRRACVLLLAAIAALAAVEAGRLARAFTGSAIAAGAAWGLALGPPLAFFGFHVYTEGPSALALCAALRLLAAPGVSPARAAVAALLASALPWLHVKLGLAAVVVGLFALIQLGGAARKAFVAVAGLMALGFMGHYQRVFGTPTPFAIYGGAPQDAAAEPLRALLGLLFDRSFGLLPFAPAFVVALGGLWPTGRPRLSRAQGVALAAGLAVLLPALFWRMWWGGQCPPARFLVPLVPLLAAAAGQRVAAGGGLARWFGPLCCAGHALVGFVVWRVSDLLLVNRGARPTRLWAALSGPVPVERYLPSMVAAAPSDWIVAVAWAVGLALLLGLDVAARRGSARADRAFSPLLAALLALALVTFVDLAAAPVGASPTSEEGAP